MWWPYSSNTSRCPSVFSDIKAGVPMQVGKTAVRLSKWISMLCKYSAIWIYQNHISVNEKKLYLKEPVEP